MFSTPVLHHRRPVYHLATCVLEIPHQVLLMGLTAPREWPNLVHWLPLMLSFQRALMDGKRKAVGDEAEQPERGKCIYLRCKRV